MELKKEDKIKFNLSPSSINVYYKSPLLFYLTYIAKVPDDTYVPVCYGLSGSIVHDCLEKYANGEITKDGAFMHLGEQWLKKNLHQHKDIKNEVLRQEDYLAALINGLKIVDQHKKHVCEERIKFPLKENDEMKIGIKGIVDLQAHTEEDEFVVIDYKTSNSINQSKDFERQALFYNYLIHREKKVLPKKTIFHYLKLGVPKTYEFTKEDIKAFEEELHALADEILSYGTDISNYPIGDIHDLFNSKKQACEREVFRRKGYSNPKTFVEMRF